MTERSIIPPQAQADLPQTPTRWDRMARKAVLARLGKLAWGQVSIVDGADRMTFGPEEAEGSLAAEIRVRTPRFYSALAYRGGLGAAESYIAGYWSCDDLVALFRILVRNRNVFWGMERGWALWRAPLRRLLHWLQRNTVPGSRANIAAHYDLGNDFYALFLDETMTYSCAVFDRPDVSLQEAQLAKYDRLCRKLRLGPDHHVIEIGTGWGGFALHAAGRYGCRVTTTTISREQHDEAQRRLREAGLGDRVEVLLQDYRDLRGTYDRLVSIEMIEAVGHQYLRTFFEVCSRLLKTDGAMALQAITITDQVYRRHTKSVDFIKRFVFPGGCLTAVTAMCDAAAGRTDLRPYHLEDITEHYATTLARWRERFRARTDKVLAMGFPESFLRLWEYYLTYCEGGFRERYIGNVQMVFTKPLWRPAE